MYLTGTYENLENRLHQLALSGADLTAYLSEAQTYTGVSGVFNTKWNTEFLHQYRVINGSGYSGNFLTV